MKARIALKIVHRFLSSGAGPRHSLDQILRASVIVGRLNPSLRVYVGMMVGLLIKFKQKEWFGKTRTIQLRWTDEKNWKNYERAEPDADAHIARLKKSWAECRAANNLKHDAKFRVIYA